MFNLCWFLELLWHLMCNSLNVHNTSNLPYALKTIKPHTFCFQFAFTHIFPRCHSNLVFYSEKEWLFIIIVLSCGTYPNVNLATAEPLLTSGPQWNWALTVLTKRGASIRKHCLHSLYSFAFLYWLAYWHLTVQKRAG